MRHLRRYTPGRDGATDPAGRTSGRKRRLDAARDWGQHSGGIMTIMLALFTLAVGLYPQPLIDLLQ